MADDSPEACVARGDAVALLAALNKLGRQRVQGGPEGEAALCLAAETGRLPCAKVLLDYGVSVECENYAGETPLTLATRGDHPAVVDLLLRRGADVLIRNRHSETALDIACEKGLFTTIDLLLRNIWRDDVSGDVREPPAHVTRTEWESFCYTALVSAVDSGHRRALAKLLDAGFEPNLSMIDEVATPLHAAIDAGSVTCADLLIESGADVEAVRPCLQQSPLATCAENNQVKIAKRLLEAGCDINRQTDECSSALIVACHYGSTQMAEFLLDNGADPSLVNSWGFTALTMAVDSPRILKRLLETDVDVNLQCGERGEGAIHMAAGVRSTEPTRLLLDAGADINLRTYHNETPLWLAVCKGHVGLVKFLIQRNCDLNVPSNDYLPLEVAIIGENFESVRMLVKAGCALRNDLHYKGNDGQKGPIDELPMLLVRSEVAAILKRNTQEKDWIKSHITKPQSLKHITRLAVRRALGERIEKKLETLPIPALMKEYLRFPDL